MLFNSLPFLLLFLPVALIGYYLAGQLGKKWASVWLVGASFVFYTWWTRALVFLLTGSIAFNFLCGVLLLRAQGRERLQAILLAIGVAGDLSLLVYYKYLFSLFNWLGYHGLLTLAHPYNVILPLGISFFTFTQIGYLVDCKGGVVKENRPLDYCLFVTFFPHLIAGPILHHREMMPQFAEPKTFRFRFDNMAVGATLFTIGLSKKVLLADQFIWSSNLTFDAPSPGLIGTWDSALSYSFQLYFDFSGYSDMACGLALLFGLRFPANFNSPYRAASIIDFWQRWHMTLTRYLTLYLYNPVALGISRRRLARGKSVSRAAIATPGGFLSMIALPTFYTMALAGIWHGAGLTFLLFGLMHAFYLTINHAWRSFGPRVPTDAPHPARRLLASFGKVGLTYLAVLLAQVMFHVSTVHGAFAFYRGMIGLGGIGAYTGDGIVSHEIAHFVLLSVAVLIIWTMPNSLQILNGFRPSLSTIKLESPLLFQWRPTLTWALAFILTAVTVFLSVTETTEFLYFRF